MAVTGKDLLSANGGEIETTLFPSEDAPTLEARLGRYVTEGYARAGSGAEDAPVKAWAYHRTYMAVYLRMSADPTSSELVDQSSVAWDPVQALRFYELARDKLAEFNALVESKGSSPKFSSGTSSTRFRW